MLVGARHPLAHAGLRHPHSWGRPQPQRGALVLRTPQSCAGGGWLGRVSKASDGGGGGHRESPQEGEAALADRDFRF